jgi:hypothetical protein
MASRRGPAMAPLNRQASLTLLQLFVLLILNLPLHKLLLKKQNNLVRSFSFLHYILLLS